LADDPSGPASGNPFATVAQTPALQSLARRLEEGGVLACGGVSRGAQPFLAVMLRQLFPKRPIVVVAEGLKTQESFQQDIETWFRFLAPRSGPGVARQPESAGASHTSEPPPATLNSRPFFYPGWEVLPHEAKLAHPDVISERLETLVALLSATGPKAGEPESDRPMIVTNVTALLQRTFSSEMLRARMRRLQLGDRIDPLDLVEWLEDLGYEPEAQVNHKGEIALRGGILDIFPLTSPWPARLEFFGDELSSLRHFDPITQISRDPILTLTLPPAGELGVLQRLLGQGASASSPIEPVGKNSPASLLDYLPPETLFLLCEPVAIAQHAQSYAQLVPDRDPFFIRWETFLNQLDCRGITRLAASEAADAIAPSSSSSQRNDARELGPQEAGDSGAEPLAFASLEAFRAIGGRAPDPLVAEAQRREFFAQLHRWLRQGFAVHLFCNNEGERQRFGEIWEEYGLDAPAGASGLSQPQPISSLERCEQAGLERSDPSVDRPAAPPVLHLGPLTRGFICDDARLVVVTDAEIFGRYKVQRPRRLKSPHARTTRSLLEIDFADLEEGDYVVHLQHGIGRYLGLQMLPPAGRSGPPQTSTAAPASGQECLVLEYAPSQPDQTPPKLYVPVSEAHLVSKYVGAGKARPPLNTLGGGRWTKTKVQAERAVRDLAGELLSIQASRASQPGHAFSADAPWQREFENSFLYEETPDQMRAILETKHDMELDKPMDRLICGDVGYGKTEVAIRATFKAVMGGKQVAVLVPTTVLAQQHFNTFCERLADYPVRVELLSRFRTAGEQQRVVRDLVAGAVDVVIGTHRLVQDDIAFKDLGLVIVDEEQRFGVMHKEKFKQLRRLVDVLTLSATPIPRTLYLALTGARDMSTIETPPQDRLPVETIVTQYDERTIRDAIQRELNREGQVFYLHNRVFDIDAVAQRLRALLPKARIVVGHGQMPADELEEVMARFVNGDADLLLSTTIIESGLDIPNANTIIIDRADRFGLSDLYQLRGRVGRYKHQAYAYLLLPRHAGLLTDARKRIRAIKQYSTLGSGFKIAMRDLEIRGAGNLLGAQQSGHITAVGFELYCQLLKQSIGALKGEIVKPSLDVQVRLDFLALSPAEESGRSEPASQVRRRRSATPILVPRETASYLTEIGPGDREPNSGNLRPGMRRSAAYIPLNYVSDSRQRIEVYRKLAEVMDESGLETLRAQLRDRFGPLPPAMQLLLELGKLKLLGRQRDIAVIETKGDKLMLRRAGDYITPGGKFPRLTKKEPKARLREIKRFIDALR